MKERTKIKGIAALSCFLAISMLLFCLSLVSFRPAYAETEVTEYTVYEKGIALNSDPAKGVKLGLKGNKADATYDTLGTIYQGMSFNLNKTGNKLSGGDYDGLLINLSNTGGKTVYAYVWLATSDGAGFARFSSASTKNQTLVQADGTLATSAAATDFYWNGAKLTIPNGAVGTWNVPLSEFKSKNGGITAFDKVVITLDVRNASTAGSGVTIGDIAGYKADGMVVETLFDADALSISYDANVTTAGFNLADLSKGTVVNNLNAANTSKGAFVTDESVLAWAQSRMAISYYEDRYMLGNTEKSVSIKYTVDSAPDTSYDVANPAYSAFYTNVSFKLSQAYDLKTNYAGALIKIANLGAHDILFNHYYLSGSNVIRYSGAVAKEYKPFISDDGENLAQSEKGIYFTGAAYQITAQTEGTWNINFANELKSGFNNATAVQEIVFALRVDERIYFGDGIEIDSIAFYDNSGVITEVFNSDNITATTDMEDATSGVNIADATKGTSVYVDMNKAVWTNRGDYYNVEGQKEFCYSWALSKIELGYTGVEIVETETEYVIHGNGIALTDDVNAGVSVTYNTTKERDQTYGVNYATFGFKLSEAIDASADGNYDGLLVKMANFSNNDIKFVNYLVAEGKIGRPASANEKVFKTFITDNGENLASNEEGIKWNGSYYLFTGGSVGTFNLDFADITSGRSNMNAVSEVVFGLRMDETLYEGAGFTISTIAAYKQDENAEGGYSVKVLYNANTKSVSTEKGNTMADINLANVAKGKTVYMKGCVNSSNTYHTENVEEINAWAMGYLNVSVKKYNITLNFEDENGVLLKNPETVSVYAGRKYVINPSPVTGFEYVSADGELTGKANGDLSLLLKYHATGEVTTYTLTVKYQDEQNNTLKADTVSTFLSGVNYTVAIPEIRGHEYDSVNGNLEGAITENTTVALVYKKLATKWNVSEVEWDVSQSEDSLYVKGSLYGGIQFMNNSQMTLIPDDPATYGKTILGLTKFNFSRAINAINGEFDGLLIRIENVSDKDLKFSAYMLNGEKIARNFVTADSRYEMFVNENGAPLHELDKGIAVANSYYTFTAGASGTWNYEFANLQTGKAEMYAADAFAIGLRQGDTAFMGKGIVISSICAYKYDESYENGYYVETLFNARDLSVTKEAGVETADVNLVDTDLGRIVNTNIYNTNNTNAYVAEEYRENLHEITLYNTSFEQRGYMVKINCLDKAGDVLRSQIKNYQTGEEYTITPEEIPNYQFVEADTELTGTVNSDMEINLYYDLAKYKITIKFVDENGNTIREDWVKDVQAGEYLVVDPTEEAEFTVQGYTYVSANNRVKFTVVRDTEIVLTFASEVSESGCVGNVYTGSMIVSFLALALTLIVIKNTKYKFSKN